MSPKGIHDSSSDKSLINGYEMQIRIHAPPDYTGNTHIETAKGFMINTVEKASFGGLKYYDQTLRLSDGTVIKARLSYGTQVVDIYPVKKGGPSNGLFLLQPKTGYPQVLIFEDSSRPDGINMRYADDVLTGNYYTQAYDKNRELMFTVAPDHPIENYIEGSLFSEHGGVGVYSNGYTIINLPYTAIGAAVVGDVGNQAIVFVCDTGSQLDFWSHPLITIDFGITDYVTPIINISACTLEHTITTVTYAGGVPTTDPVGYTPCTFSKDGTVGVVSSLLGNTKDNTHVTPTPLYPYVSTSEQDIYDLTLSASGGVVSVSHVRSDQSYRKTITEVVALDEYTFDQNVAGAIFGSAIDDAGVKSEVTFYTSASEEQAYGQFQCVPLTPYPDPIVTFTDYEYKFNWKEYKKILSSDANNVTSGGNHTTLNKYLVLIPKQFSLREGISITEVYRRPYVVSTRTPIGPPPQVCHDTAVIYNYDASMFLTFDTPAGSVDIPGLPMWHGDFNDEYDAQSFWNYADIDPGLSDVSADTDTHYQSLGIPARSIDFHGNTSRNGNSFPDTRVKMCSHPLGYAMYSTCNYYMLANQSEVDLNTATMTLVLGIYNPLTKGFVNLLSMYNALIAGTPSLGLSPLTVTGIAATTSEREYMFKYGPVNKLPDVGLSP